jgi:hypothetical protein
MNRLGFSGGASPESGDYLIQSANQCGSHVNRWEFESCPIGRIEDPSEGPLLARPDRMASSHLFSLDRSPPGDLPPPYRSKWGLR